MKMQAGCYWWRHHTKDDVLIRLNYLPRDKLDIEVWWNNQSTNIPNLRLWVRLESGRVEFADLTSNKYGSPLHRIGLGTFVVNIAVQVLQTTYDPNIKVEGILSNPNDNNLPGDLPEQLAENRRQFWARFGLSITPGNSPGDYEQISGTVGTLRRVTDGLVADQFSRYVPLSEFKYSST